MQKSSLNKFMGIGRLGSKPELKYTPKGTAVTNFSIATTESFKGPDGNYQDSTEWINLVVWNKTAEFCANYLEKGGLIFVEGRLQTRSWEDREGKKQYRTEVVANTITPLAKAPGQSNQQQADNGRYPDSPANNRTKEPPTPEGNPFSDEDGRELPF